MFFGFDSAAKVMKIYKMKEKMKEKFQISAKIV